MPASDSDTKTAKPLLGWGTFVLALGAGGATWWMAQNAAWTEEHFSRGWYLRVRDFQQSFGARVGFSVAEPLAALVIAAVLLQTLRAVWLGPGFWRRVWALVAVPMRSAVGLYVLYLVLWGGNQHRLSLDQRLGLAPDERSPAALVALAETVVRQLVEDAPQVQDRSGFRQGIWDGTPVRIQAALARLAPEFPEFRAAAPVIRGFGNSDLWAQLGIAGIFVPFTGESHMHTEGPPTRWPFSALHESMHQRGYAREDEANFLAWWAAQRSGDPYLRYSANLVAWAYVGRALLLADPSTYLRLHQALPATVRADQAAQRAFWKRHESPLREVGQRSNDLFLKSQGQHEGILAYGQMVRWMLAVDRQSR